MRASRTHITGRSTLRPLSFIGWRGTIAAPLTEKHTNALCKMMANRGVAVKTCSEAQKAPLWLTLVDEARKGGMRLPAV
jgi:hypothetical protein